MLLKLLGINSQTNLQLDDDDDNNKIWICTQPDNFSDYNADYQGK